MTLQELLERVKAATGPDRELDHTIEARMREHVGSMGFGIYKTADEWIPQAIKRNFNSPRYTASIDAALALTERVLPGAGYMYQKPRAGWERRPGLHGYASIGFGEPLKAFTADAPTAPLAILAATLTALASKAHPSLDAE